MVVTVGFFDGVHIGHRRVIATLLERGEDAVAVTFWPHPRVALQQDASLLKFIDSPTEKAALLRSLGLSDVRIINFDRAFAALTAEEFIREYLVKQVGCTCLVLGSDNHLGSDALDYQGLKPICDRLGIETVIVPPCFMDGSKVSSTRIRTSIAAGRVEEAARMLGRPYSLDGVVVSGNRIGRTLGFPTANLKLSFPLKVVPAGGVYASESIIGGRRYRSMTNIGVRPTVATGPEVVIETNIFDFDEDIYGHELRLEFLSRIREEVKFSSLEALAEQLDKDRKKCRCIK